MKLANTVTTLFLTLGTLVLPPLTGSGTPWQARPHQTPEDKLGARVEARLSGEQLRAIIASFSALKTIPDLPERKKKPQNYKVRVSRAGGSIYVHFLPKIVGHGGAVELGGETYVGREVLYKVNAATGRIVRRWFFM